MNIILPRPAGVCLRGRLSSNVRPHKSTTSPSVHEFLAPLAAWLASVAIAVWIQRREFNASPDKASRYRRLPIAYKLTCLGLVVPLFAAVPLLLFGSGHAVLAAIVGIAVAPASLLLLELAVVRWYRGQGLL